MFAIRLIREIRALGHRWGFGVQSPFAYNLIRAIKSGKTPKEIYQGTVKEVDIDNKTEIENLIENASDKTLIVIYGPYRNMDAYHFWKQLCQKDKVRVSFDFYNQGLLVIQDGFYKKDYII